MRLKTWLIVGSGIVCLAVFVFGREALSYVAGARQYTNAAIKDHIDVFVSNPIMLPSWREQEISHLA